MMESCEQVHVEPQKQKVVDSQEENHDARVIVFYGGLSELAITCYLNSVMIQDLFEEECLVCCAAALPATRGN
jgi:hypothetical protein